MIIGIDIRMLARGTRTGVEEYTLNLLSYLIPLNKNVRYRLFYNGFRKINLDCLNYPWLKEENVKLVSYKIPNQLLNLSSRLLNYPKLDKLLGGVDVFFSPHIFLSAISRKCPNVITFHDLSFEQYSEFYSAGKNYWHFSMSPKNQAKRANKIIAVSQSTKDDLIKLYNIEPNKIKVVYSGINPVFSIQYSVFSIPEIRKKYDLPEKYILYLGTLEPRKNIIGLIKAFEKLKTSFKFQSPIIAEDKVSSFKLVIAGSKGWLYENIFKTADKSSVKNDIIFTGFIDDKDKPILYGLADLFVYPSFYEGFGFPPLEAMACQTPVITSNFSSIPEAVGDAAIMVNPYNLDELATAMKLVLLDKNLQNLMIEKGLKQVKKFSWQKCAEETLKVLTSTVRN
jgi:glycosyltransferase involved in cell wall biosynthesis